MLGRLDIRPRLQSEQTAVGKSGSPGGERGRGVLVNIVVADAVGGSQSQGASVRSVCDGGGNRRVGTGLAVGGGTAVGEAVGEGVAVRVGVGGGEAGDGSIAGGGAPSGLEQPLTTTRQPIRRRGEE